MSTLYTPQVMTRGAVFSARQYPRNAFSDRTDPVLNVDWFKMQSPTFPSHPHVGFSSESNDELTVEASEAMARLVIVGGRQPIYTSGSLMLASPETLAEARDYVAGLSISRVAEPSIGRLK